MVRITNWESFSLEAQALHESSAGQARLLMKYKHRDGLLVIKVTDDIKTITFRTSDKDDIRYIEKLQQWFLTEAINPAKVAGSAEHAASNAVGAGAPAAARSRGAGAEPGYKGANTKRSTESGAQRRKAHRQAVKAGTKQPTEAEQRRALHKAAQRGRKKERREKKQLLAAAGAGPALPAIIPATSSR